MDDLLKLAGTVLGVLAAGVGLVITVDQLTLRSRLRKTETWARDALKDESNQHRREYLINLQSKAVAGIVGSIEVPFRFFAEALMLFAGVGFAVVSILTEDSGHLTTGAVVTACVLGFGSTLLGFRRGVRVYLERRRIVNTYRDSRGPVTGARLSLLQQTEGGLRWEFLAAAGFSVGAMGVYSGIAAFVRESQNIGLLLLVSGGGVLWMVANWVYSRGKVV